MNRWEGGDGGEGEEGGHRFAPDRLTFVLHLARQLLQRAWQIASVHQRAGCQSPESSLLAPCPPVTLLRTTPPVKTGETLCRPVAPALRPRPLLEGGQVGPKRGPCPIPCPIGTWRKGLEREGSQDASGRGESLCSSLHLPLSRCASSGAPKTRLGADLIHYCRNTNPASFFFF